jgi:hypothetical protein
MTPVVRGDEKNEKQTDDVKPKRASITPDDARKTNE